MIYNAIEGILLLFILIALCVIHLPYRNMDILYMRFKMNLDTEIKTLENQKIVADTIAVPLSKEELELLIDKLCDRLISDKQALNLYQKLNKKLETLLRE